MDIQTRVFVFGSRLREDLVYWCRKMFGPYLQGTFQPLKKFFFWPLRGRGGRLNSQRYCAGERGGCGWLDRLSQSEPSFSYISLSEESYPSLLPIINYSHLAQFCKFLTHQFCLKLSDFWLVISEKIWVIFGGFR